MDEMGQGVVRNKRQGLADGILGGPQLFVPVGRGEGANVIRMMAGETDERLDIAIV